MSATRSHIICKRPVVAKPRRRIEQGVFLTIVQMAYEMDKAERDYYEPVTRVKNVMKEVFNEHYPQGRRLPIPKIVTGKQPQCEGVYRSIADHMNQSHLLDCQETDTPTKWSKRFYLPSIILGRKVEQVADNVWKITPYVTLTGKVLFSNNQRERRGKEWRTLPNGMSGLVSKWVDSDTFKQYTRSYEVSIAYSNKSQSMEAFDKALKLYTSWLNDARDVNSLEQFNRKASAYTRFGRL